jgi:hypothetical protein
VSRLLGIVAMAILARALMVTVIDGTLRHAEQSTIAANLNAGRGFVFEQYGAVYRAWKEPLYILMLAGVTRVVGTGDLTLRLFDGLVRCRGRPRRRSPGAAHRL